jgi:hypothetical protein
MGHLRDEEVIETRRGVFIIKDESALRQKVVSLHGVNQKSF